MKNEALKRIISSIIIIPLALFFIVKGSIFFIFFITFCFLIASYEWYILSKNRQYNLPGHLFLFISFYSAYLYREYLSQDAELFLFIILICVSTDIGGYIFGKTFGGKKLTKVSPNKTISGSIGSFIFAILSLIIFVNLEYLNLDFNQSNIIFCFFVSLISQIGDLFISYLKRKAKVKDTGKILPGHGGLLDRLDGIIFAVPFSYLMLKLI